MASGVSIEILDLRHFAAPLLRPVLEAEGELWRQRLHWDHRVPAKLLMQYLDSHVLPGYAALDAGQITGYVFCVYEESKAIIGDLFALPGPHPDAGAAGRFLARENPAHAIQPHEFSPHEIEETLLRHLLELLVNSPQVDRVESQLLLHPSGAHAQVFREAGFQIYRRLFMVRPLAGFWGAPRVNLPAGLELRPWRDEDVTAAGSLITEAYRDHPDSVINDQYRSLHGSLRFLHNIVHHSGCGVFSVQISHVVVERSSRRLVALLLGSRVSPESGHITQLCVHPSWRRRGLARMLLTLAASCFLRQGVSEISLTVTEANAEAVELYRSEGYDCVHSFDAAVWRRGSHA
jgi:ribosomal protein S18 acetylase RimI-like enzyme